MARSSRRPDTRPGLPVPWRRLLLIALVTIVYALVAIHNDWPPYNWIDHVLHRHDKVVKHRPGFKKVDRYSNQHRYRPAASPVVTKKNMLGRKKKHGDYHDL